MIVAFVLNLIFNHLGDSPRKRGLISTASEAGAVTGDATVEDATVGDSAVDAQPRTVDLTTAEAELRR